MKKPYIICQTTSGITYRQYTEGLPDGTMDDFWKNGKRELTSDEKEELKPDEWVKYYFWLQTEVLRKINRLNKR